MPPRRGARGSARVKTEDSADAVNVESTSTANRRPAKRIKHEVKDAPSEETVFAKHEPSHDSDTEAANEADDDADGDEELDYEAQRLANIRRNEQQLRELALSAIIPPSMTPSSSSAAAKRRAPTPKKLKAPAMPARRSLRNQGLDPEGNMADVRSGEPRYVPDLNDWAVPAPRRSGPLDMNDIVVEVRGRNIGLMSQAEDNKEMTKEDGDNDSDDSKSNGDSDENKVNPLVDEICSTFTAFQSQSQTKKSQADRSNIPALTPSRIQSFELVGMSNKLVKKRITSMLYHPHSSMSRSIVMTGDKAGSVNVMVHGEVDTLSNDSNRSRQLCFAPHNGVVQQFLCHRYSTNTLYSCSNDGTVRAFDFEHQSFAECWMHDDEECLYAMCSPSDSPHIIYTCDRKGSLVQLDSQSPLSLKEVGRTSLSNVKVAHIDIHPLHSHLLVSASNDRTVSLWDTRMLKDHEPVHSYLHGYAVNSAFFSPSGDYLLSTCIDDYLRVWQCNGDVRDWDQQPLKIHHNNKTGRWVTQFKARWTRTDDAFVVGNMDRKIDVYSVSASKGRVASALYSLTSSDLSAIPSVTAMHPSNQILAGATASGYTYFWRTP